MPSALKKNRYHFVDKETQGQEKWAVFGDTEALKPRADSGFASLTKALTSYIFARKIRYCAGNS